MKATVGTTTTAHVGNYYEWNVGTATARKYYSAGSERVAMQDNGTLYYLFGDHLGSTARTYKADDGTTTELRYKAWGETRYNSKDSGGNDSPTTFRNVPMGLGHRPEGFIVDWQCRMQCAPEVAE